MVATYPRGVLIKVDTDVPLQPGIGYAHEGRRHRSYTDELFRCPACGALLWRSRTDDLREHLGTHTQARFTDQQMQDFYWRAAKIPLPGVRDDDDDDYLPDRGEDDTETDADGE